MRTIVNYIRSLFCNHNFKTIKDTKMYVLSTYTMPYETIRSKECTKCGWIWRQRL